MLTPEAAKSHLEQWQVGEEDDRLPKGVGRLTAPLRAVAYGLLGRDERGESLDYQKWDERQRRLREAGHRLDQLPRKDRCKIFGAVALQLAEALDEKRRKLFGRSLKLRQVSAGGSGACEADLNVLGTVVFDLGRFGISFVASPRHADGLVVTGPVSENMRLALLETYTAIPAPKLVIVVGAEAISGGVFRDHPEVHNGVGSLLPVDLYIPGWPPHPLTILDGFLRLLGRLEGK